MKRKRKYFAKINTLQSPRCTGAASLCAVAALAYLFVQDLLTIFVSALMGMRVQGASLSDPVGFSVAVQGLLGIVVAAGSIVLPLWWLLRATRLQTQDLRILLPAPWSPAFCLVVFFGAGQRGQPVRRAAGPRAGRYHQQHRAARRWLRPVHSLFQSCVVPAVLEEIYFRGALQGIMRPSGSSVAIFAPALLFALLHLRSGTKHYRAGVRHLLGWLVERSGSILPGMLLHFINNTLAFLSLYLRQYAPEQLAVVYELILLVALPLAALFLVWRVKVQGFSFSAGLRGGMEPLAVFTSLPYTVCVLFLMGLTVYLYRVG